VAPPHVVRTEAVVLRRHDLGEADRIITLYTSHAGKVRAVAKGVRRPTSRLGGHLELFTHSRLMLARGRNLDLITQVETVDPFIGLREDLWRAGLAYYVAELVDRLTEDRAENQALFQLLVTTLGRIATERRASLALNHFELQMLSLLGYRPELRVCVGCRKPLEPIDNSFSLSSGGVLCPECSNLDPMARRLSANALKVLRLHLADDWTTANRLRIDATLADELEQTIRAYGQFIAETQLKSADFVATLRRDGISAPANVGAP
jgi:DNA repair protein RecO (recombination protein O)